LETIIFFIDNLGPGGAQRQIVNLACKFKKNDYKVVILTYHKENFYESELDSEGIDVKCMYKKSKLIRFFKIITYIRRKEHLALISFLDTPNLISCISNIKRRKAKLILGIRNSGTEISKIRYNLNKWFYRFADYIVANSYSAEKVLIGNYPKYLSKITTIYNGIIIDDNMQDTKYIPRENEKTSVLIAASYRKVKNINELIEAVNLLNDDEKQKIKINWYGDKYINNQDTSEYDRALKKIKSYGISDVLELHPATKEIFDKMIASDFVALFSLSEGLPNTICEAMYLGKPIIITKISDFNKFIKNKNGILCETFDSLSILTALRKAIETTPVELYNMGKNSRATATKLFKMESTFREYKKLIDS